VRTDGYGQSAYEAFVRVRFIRDGAVVVSVYSARDRVENEEWIAELRRAAESLDLSGRAKSNAADIFLTGVPERERSKRAVAAASLYAGALIAGEERSQSAVADAMGVARLSIQNHWKELLEEAGFRAPEW
jgi:transcription initiation factor TFIIIB Brf1 subunit/transcription initiation factor TFIIB